MKSRVEEYLLATENLCCISITISSSSVYNGCFGANVCFDLSKAKTIADAHFVFQTTQKRKPKNEEEEVTSNLGICVNSQCHIFFDISRLYGFC